MRAGTQIARTLGLRQRLDEAHRERDEALAMQLALERDGAAAGQADPHVYDELVLLHRASGIEKLADDAEQRAQQLRKRKPSAP